MKIKQAFLSSILGTTYLVTLPFKPVQAQLKNPAITNITGGSATSTLADSTVGWSFTVNQTDTYDYLGFWDEDADGLNLPHEVGIWDSERNLLASTTIQMGTGSLAMFETSDPYGIFRWEPITPITLTPGETYTIGAFYCTTRFCSPGGVDIGIDFFPVPDFNNSNSFNVDFNPNINFQTTNLIDSYSLSFPSIEGGGAEGVNLAQSIPEPLTILGNGLTVLAIVLLKKINSHSARTCSLTEKANYAVNNSSGLFHSKKS